MRRIHNARSNGEPLSGASFGLGLLPLTSSLHFAFDIPGHLPEIDHAAIDESRRITCLSFPCGLGQSRCYGPKGESGLLRPGITAIVRNISGLVITPLTILF
jgi:hypothetical protein